MAFRRLMSSGLTLAAWRGRTTSDCGGICTISITSWASSGCGLLCHPPNDVQWSLDCSSKHVCRSAGAFANYLPELLGDLAAYKIVSCEEDDATATVTVCLQDSNQQDTRQVRFHLARKVKGRSAGSWMTASLVRDTA